MKENMDVLNRYTVNLNAIDTAGNILNYDYTVKGLFAGVLMGIFSIKWKMSFTKSGFGTMTSRWYPFTLPLLNAMSLLSTSVALITLGEDTANAIHG